MPEGVSRPRCRICDAQMALFYQLDIRAEFDVPFQQGSHLLVFMCPTHNEIPGIPAIYNDSPLPEAFWDTDDGHYALRFYRAENLRNDGKLDEYISSHDLRFERAEEEVQDFDDFKVGSYKFKIGGVPGWMNYSVDKNCPCGGKMSFVCQTPDGFGFRQTPTAPEQPDSFSSVKYCLFLGNHVNILACDRQCDSRALIATCDN